MSSLVPPSSFAAPSTTIASPAAHTPRPVFKRALSDSAVVALEPSASRNLAPVPSPITALRAPESRDSIVSRLARADRNEATAIFDALPAVKSEALTGTWRGSEVSRDHALSGLLPAFGWYGKRFESTESVHPLVFSAIGGGTFSVNPGWVPMRIGAYVPRWNVGKWLMNILRPVVGTHAPKARLRDTKYHDVTSAAMHYDQLPIIDYFRQIDADTLLGVMDYRYNPQPFYFLLQRDNKPEAQR